jgi:hypothetical protein
MNNKRSIVTYTGKSFNFMSPRIEDICIEDIAHALSLTNRFNGHTRVPYSVAEHCIRASYLGIGNPLDVLLHDAAEAYMGDIPRPHKTGLCWFHSNTYKYLEQRVLETIYLALGLTHNFSSDTKKADEIMLATEIRDLMHISSLFEQWYDHPNVSGKIAPWSWEVAEQKYLKRFKELTQ